jgi:hypothetical protein
MGAERRNQTDVISFPFIVDRYMVLDMAGEGPIWLVIFLVCSFALTFLTVFLWPSNNVRRRNARCLWLFQLWQKEAYENENRRYFFIPQQARWSVLSERSENIGEK